MPVAQQVINYPYGTRLRHRVRIEVADEPEDPTSLTVLFVTPAGIEDGPYSAVRVGTGEYKYERTYSSTLASSMWGSWTIRWTGIGDAEGAVERTHFIATSRFT
jgi:hypothetical protein